MLKRLINLNLFIVVVCLLQACAALNNSTKKVCLHTQEGVLVAVNQDTLQTSARPLPLNLPRQKEDVRIILTKDSLTKEVSIPSRLSGLYWLNFFNYGIGYLIDLTHDKRFTYPTHIYTDISDTLKPYRNYPPVVTRGSWLISIDLPEFNVFHLQPYQLEQPLDRFGFVGFNLGTEYFYQDDRFIHTGIVGAVDFFLPIPAPVYGWGYNESTSIATINLSHGQRYKRWSYSHGLSYSRLAFRTWNNWQEDNITDTPQTFGYTSGKLGFYFDLHYQLGNTFHLGAIYTPTLWRFDGGAPAYEHWATLQLSWKLPLYKDRL